MWWREGCNSLHLCSAVQGSHCDKTESSPTGRAFIFLPLSDSREGLISAEGERERELSFDFPSVFRMSHEMPRKLPHHCSVFEVVPGAADGALKALSVIKWWRAGFPVVYILTYDDAEWK